MENFDWKNLPFGYHKTDYNVRCYYRNGKWGELEVSSSEYLNIHMAATSLHYGQEAFEGMKVFKSKEGKTLVFRWEENAQRMINTANYIRMAPMPKDLFKEAIFKVIKLNEKYVPPYESGASLYVRPLLIGTGAEVGVKPAGEYCFVVFVTPVGPYFKDGFKPIDVLICRDYDRAAPLGTGHIKVGGNYAASLLSLQQGHDEGYESVLYLDAKEKKYIDECGQANFFGVRGNSYITPESRSVLPSITNKSLMVLAKDMGLTVEKRKIPVDELATFDEAGACGTAAVISPIDKIFDPESNKSYHFCKNGEVGPVCTKLYNRLRAIQYGDDPDKFGWVEEVK